MHNEIFGIYAVFLKCSLKPQTLHERLHQIFTVNWIEFLLGISPFLSASLLSLGCYVI